MAKRKNKKVNKFDEAIGWLGVSSYVLAYILLTIGFFSSSNISLHLMYLLGALGLIYHSFKKHDMQPVIVNFFFAVIALTALVNLIKII